ncbi:MAG: hypothetical protein L6R40_003651 [Gallowayella cf. fulva]|nr:MAG: hypothetical protein L6R40_003651 [Xanthomendoza cf. fulva]
MSSFSADEKAAAALDLIHQVCDNMYGEHITFGLILHVLHAIEDVVEETLPLHPNVEAAAKVSHDIFDIAIDEVENRASKYRRNKQLLRQLAGYEVVNNPNETADWDRSQVLSDLRRDWRLLGNQEASCWEDLYELATGKELMNE